MKKHTCKNCNRIFEYCRGCLLSPIPHKDAGFCSKECYEASKQVVETKSIEDEVVNVEVEETIVENNEPSIEEEPVVENIVLTEAPIEKTTNIIKNETNTYKKKKNKYKYTSSY